MSKARPLHYSIDPALAAEAYALAEKAHLRMRNGPLIEFAAFGDSHVWLGQALQKFLQAGIHPADAAAGGLQSTKSGES